MAEAVRPRKKQRKKKGEKISKKQTDDVAEDLLRYNEEEKMHFTEKSPTTREEDQLERDESRNEVVEDKETEARTSSPDFARRDVSVMEKESADQSQDAVETAKTDSYLEDAKSVDTAKLNEVHNGLVADASEETDVKGLDVEQESETGREMEVLQDSTREETADQGTVVTELRTENTQGIAASLEFSAEQPQSLLDETNVEMILDGTEGNMEDASTSENLNFAEPERSEVLEEDAAEISDPTSKEAIPDALPESFEDEFEILQAEEESPGITAGEGFGENETVPRASEEQAGDMMDTREAVGEDLPVGPQVEKVLEATAPPEHDEKFEEEAVLEQGVTVSRDPLVNIAAQDKILPRYMQATQAAEPVVKTEGKTDVISELDTEEVLNRRRQLLKEESTKTSKVLAMTEEQLEMFYHNPVLKQQEEFVELFVKVCNIERHEFYELVLNYFKARNNMLAIRGDIGSMQSEYATLKENLWTTAENFILAKGMCADNLTVKENYPYKLVSFNAGVQHDLERLMKYMRSNVHDTFALCSYTAQLSKLQIESYIHLMYLRNPCLGAVEGTAPVVAELSCGDPQQREQVEHLKQCISVLFAFQRRPVSDEEFLKLSRRWLSRLMATLLRLATLEDHLFVLGHILRCPAGVDQWAASYLQVIVPSHETAVDRRWPYSIGTPLLDHFLNTLAFFMRPVKFREEFLSKIKKVMTPNPAEKQTAFNWTLLDEDGEEDENTDNTLLNENDLVAILDQYPFDKMFKYVLQITESDGKASYSVDRVGSHHMMQLIAFATSVIQVFHEGVQTFNRSRYRQFVKRIGRLIRHTVQQVSDHWLNYHCWRSSVCNDADDVKPAIEPYDLQHSIHSLQMEFDEFFFRATKCIMSAPRLGTWQFMTNMPYTSLSSTMMWRLLWSLHQNNMNELSILPGRGTKIDSYKWSLADPANREDFVHKLMDMPMSEVIYLLTTFANMTSARPAAEKMFIDYVVEEIYELAYLQTHTREFCSKIGRELLSAIATTHPFIISTLLNQVKGSCGEVGGVSLYLFRGLPIHLWRPKNDDIAMIREWMIDSELSRPENQLAQLVLAKMNWGFNKQEDALFLELSLHRSTAILVLEAYLKVLTAKSPGAVRLGTGPFSGQEHAFDLWAWELIPKLRLHRQHQPRPVLLASSSESIAGDDFGVLPNPHTNTKYYPLQKALQTNVALGCFVAVAMSSAGHSVDSFITQGIAHMYTLIQAGCQNFCLPLLAVVVPMFLEEEHLDYLLTNEKFLTIVNRIILADQQGTRSSTSADDLPGDTTKLFAGMVLTQIQRSLAPCTNAPSAEVVLEFWLKLLTAIRSNWHYDQDVCYILDMVLSAAFCNKGGCSIAEEAFLSQYQEMKSDTKPQGFISSMLSLVSSSNLSPSLLEKASLERPWLAYCILSAETRYLEETGLLKQVSLELCQDSNLTPDIGLKRACQKLKLDYNIPIARLPIFRWSLLALETQIDHPLLPVIWQRFFMIYLQRVSADAGMSPRASIGQRYFQSIANLTYLKKLKKRLTQTADYHHEASRKKPDPRPSSSSQMDSTDQEEDGESEPRMDGLEGEFEGEAEHHSNLVKLYQMYLLWLEEPLLHDASLYLPSLPSQYEAEKLSRIFNGDQDLWMEYVDGSTATRLAAQLVNKWVRMSQPETAATGFFHSLTTEQEQIDTATSRILNRLTHYKAKLEPPSVVPIVPPVPDVPKELLVNNHAMLVFLQDDIKQLLFYADTFSERENRNVVLDCEFLEAVPDLYANKDIQERIQIPCKSSFNPMHKCKGPAVVTIVHKSKCTNEIISRRLDENRVEFKQLSIESLAPPPSTVVVSAVHIENAITDLIHFSRSLEDSTAEFEAAKQTGVSLLYHLGNQMSESARHYPPTRQFFSSCIEILGQEYIRPYPDQAQPLLSAILTNCNLAGLLAPNLAPNLCGDSFVQMYSDVVRVAVNNKHDTAFMLLTKFDPVQWMSSCQPVLTVRSQFIEVIGEALMACGQEMGNQTMMTCEIFRNHLQAMLMHQFPEHYGDVLRLVLKGSEERSLHEAIWHDTLKSLGCPLLTITSDSVSHEQVQELIRTHPLLSLQQLKETIEWLSSYFSRQRNSNPQCGQFGLHSNWNHYHQPLVSFLGYIMLNTIILEAHRVREANLDAEQALRRMWTLLSGLFYSWIVALEVPSPTNPNTKQLLPPWVDGDRVPASCMVSMFTHGIGCIQAQFQDYLDPSAVNSLSLLWPFYNDTLARKGLREDILTTYHQHLVQLPWNQFHPDLNSMQLMVQVFEDRGPACLSFLGNIFPRIPWREICETYCQEGVDTSSSSNTFLSLLLSLLVIFLNEDDVMKAQGVSMQHLIAQAKEFPWQLLDVESYESAAAWQVERCDPKCVLHQPKKHEASSVSLMRGVARFNTPSSLDTAADASKRASYVNLVVRLLTKCSTLDGARKDWFPAPVQRLLNDIELLATAAGPSSSSRQEELVSLLSSLLSLLNSCSPLHGAPDAILNAILTWFEASTSSALGLPCITAACRTLASIKHSALVVEACIKAHFNTNTDLSPDPLQGWTNILQVLRVPELTHNDFLEECVKQGAILTLYAYLDQRSPQCQTLEEENTLFTELIDWCVKCKVRPADEAKIYLWWHKALKMTLHQLEFGSPHSIVSRSLNNLVPSMITLGEDRSSTGILGAIGFGRHSELSYRFRLIARCMAAFTAAQVLRNGTIRLAPNDPGALTRHREPASQAATSPDSPKPSSLAHSALKQLDAAIDNKNYVGLTEHARYARDLTLNPLKCLQDATHLLSELVTVMFPEKHYLSVIRII